VTPFLWFTAVILLYAVAGSTIVLIGAAIRLRLLAILLLILMGAVIGMAVSSATKSVYPVNLITGALVYGAVLSGVYFGLLRPRLTWQDIKQNRENLRQTTLHLILLSGSVIFMVPFAWLVVTSLKEEEEMSKFPPVWVPRQQVKIMLDGKEAGLATLNYEGQTVKVAVVEEKETGERRVRILEPSSLQGRELTVSRSQITKIKQFAPVWENYPNALKFLPPETYSGLLFLINTLKLCALTIFGTLLSSSLVAFSFARLRWPGRDMLFVVLLATMMLPGAVTMMPLFLIFRWLGWIDTLRPLWVPAFFGSAFNIFLLRQFFLTIPNDLEDAAKIDGCSFFGIYWRIMLPLIKPALAAITIMTFMGAWNNFMGPLIYISSPENMPLAYALQLFQTARGGEPGLLMAASTMMMLPVLVIFFFTQRYFIQGVTLTGIKG
jgi:multiple sugar transport system permease protein